MTSLPAHTRTVLGVALTIGVAFAAPVRAQRPDSLPTVAVMYFDNGALVDRAMYDPMRKGLTELLITELQGNPRIRVVEREALQRILEEQRLAEERRTDPMTSARIGQLLGAQHVILGAFFVDRKGRLRLDARAVSVETSRLEFAQSVEGKADDVLDVIADLAKRLNAGLALPGSLTGAKPPAPMKRASPFSAMMTYARAVAEDDARRSREALALYRQFLDETEPTFAVAQRRKAEARVRALSGS